MKRLLPALLLVGCTQRGPVVVQHGETTVTIGQRTNFMAESYDRYAVTKAGTLTITTRDKATEVPGEVVRTAGMAYGAHVVASVQKAADAGSHAVALGAQKAGVKEAAIAADLEKAKVGADTIIRTTIPK